MFADVQAPQGWDWMLGEIMKLVRMFAVAAAALSIAAGGVATTSAGEASAAPRPVVRWGAISYRAPVFVFPGAIGISNDQPNDGAARAEADRACGPFCASRVWVPTGSCAAFAQSANGVVAWAHAPTLREAQVRANNEAVRLGARNWVNTGTYVCPSGVLVKRVSAVAKVM